MFTHFGPRAFFLSEWSLPSRIAPALNAGVTTPHALTLPREASGGVVLFDVPIADVSHLLVLDDRRVLRTLILSLPAGCRHASKPNHRRRKPRCSGFQYLPPSRTSPSNRDFSSPGVELPGQDYNAGGDESRDGFVGYALQGGRPPRRACSAARPRRSGKCKARAASSPIPNAQSQIPKRLSFGIGNWGSASGEAQPAQSFKTLQTLGATVASLSCARMAAVRSATR